MLLSGRAACRSEEGSPKGLMYLAAAGGAELGAAVKKRVAKCQFIQEKKPLLNAPLSKRRNELYTVGFVNCFV